MSDEQEMLGKIRLTDAEIDKCNYIINYCDNAIVDKCASFPKKQSIRCKTLLAIDQLNKVGYLQTHKESEMINEIILRGGSREVTRQAVNIYLNGKGFERALKVYYRRKEFDVDAFIESQKSIKFNLMSSDRFNLTWISKMSPISDTAKLKARVLLTIDESGREEASRKYKISDDYINQIITEYRKSGINYVIRDCNAARQADIEKRICISNIIREQRPTHLDLGWTVEDIKIQLKDRYHTMVSSNFIETVINQIGYTTVEYNGWYKVITNTKKQ
jgi:hypothetical protein